jgi:hypothetical protein
LSKLASLSFDFKPLYAAIAKECFHSFRVFPIEKVDGNFLDSEGCFVLNLFKLAASQLERKWMSILLTFFPRGYNLEGKSNNGCSPRVHKASECGGERAVILLLLILITNFAFLSMFFLMFL